MSAPATPGEPIPPTRTSAGAPPLPPGPPVVPPYVPPAVPPYAAAAGYPPTAQTAAPRATPLPASQPGYASPEHPASAHGYGTPQGFAPPSGYATPPQGYGPYAAAAPRSRPIGRPGLGIAAFCLAVAAVLGATVLGSVAGYSIGLGTGRDLALIPGDIDWDWSILTPVRGWVLLGELAFWAGTALGIWAIVQGIVATVKARGRGWGVAAIVIAAIGPIAFGIGAQGFLAVGFAAGASLL
ncbi:hypothetical protein [Microbacterium terregens]|uniref:Uncharacterized protein n=1 Tax=Microbacterium terregens TaxID=69363 RepID=A0ABV5T1R7_9MICO